MLTWILGNDTSDESVTARQSIHEHFGQNPTAETCFDLTARLMRLNLPPGCVFRMGCMLPETEWNCRIDMISNQLDSARALMERLCDSAPSALDFQELISRASVAVDR
jgi:hypothetical protein